MKTFYFLKKPLFKSFSGLFLFLRNYLLYPKKTLKEKRKQLIQYASLFPIDRIQHAVNLKPHIIRETV